MFSPGGKLSHRKKPYELSTPALLYILGPLGATQRGQRDAAEDARTAEEDASVAVEEDARTSRGREGFVIWLVAQQALQAQAHKERTIKYGVCR